MFTKRLLKTQEAQSLFTLCFGYSLETFEPPFSFIPFVDFYFDFFQEVFRPDGPSIELL